MIALMILSLTTGDLPKGKAPFQNVREIHDISEGAKSALSLDFDGDGDTDIVASTDHRLKWFEFDKGEVTERTIDDAFDRGVFTVLDVDGDGDLDIAGACRKTVEGYEKRDFVWWENVARSKVWRARSVSVLEKTTADISSGDIDGDGDADVLFADERGLHWIENAGSGKWSTPELIIGFKDAGITGVLTDFAGKGEIGLLVGSRYKTAVLTLEGEEWKTTELAAPGHFMVGDYDGNGRADVFFMSDKVGIQFLLTDGEGGFETIGVTEHGSKMGDAFPVDLDGDGDFDVVARTGHRELSRFINGGDGTFEKKPLSDRVFGLVHAGDIDGDGDADVLDVHTDRITTWQQKAGRLGKKRKKHAKR